MARLAIRVEEARIPIRDAVSGACEMLGLDPLYVACEGRFALFVPERESARAVEVLRRWPVSAAAAEIGRVQEGPAGTVILRSRIGANRVLETPSGEQLPRIC